MQNRRIWAWLMAASLLLTMLAGCQKQDTPVPGGAQPGQPTAPSTGATQAPDAVSQPNTEEAPVTTEPSESPADAEPLPADPQWLCKSWCTLLRRDYDGYSVLVIQDISFWDYGKGMVYDVECLYWDPATGQEIASADEKTETGPDIFDYTLDGNRLSLTFTHNDIEDYEDYTVVYTIERSEDDTSVTFSEADVKSPVAAAMFMHWDRDSKWYADPEKMCGIFSVECNFFRPWTPQEPPAPPVDTTWIQGPWTTVMRDDGTENGWALIYHVTKVTYTFNEDGTGSINEYGWVGRPGLGWEVAGMGFVETYFSYTLEGNTLTIIHTGDEFEEYPESRRHSLVYDVVRNGNGSITWFPDGGGEDRVFRKVAEDSTAEELLHIFSLIP